MARASRAAFDYFVVFRWRVSIFKTNINVYVYEMICLKCMPTINRFWGFFKWYVPKYIAMCCWYSTSFQLTNIQSIAYVFHIASSFRCTHHTLLEHDSLFASIRCCMFCMVLYMDVFIFILFSFGTRTTTIQAYWAV